HANRFPHMALDAYDAGVVITSGDVNGLAHLLINVIWDGSMTSPQFANFIDGTNGLAFGRSAWGNGQVYSGWVLLAGYDAQAQNVAEATLTAIINNLSNPSLDYMSTVYGKVNLTGFVTRSLRMAQVCQ